MTFNQEFIKSPFLETVKIKIVISLVITSGNIDLDFTEKSQYFIGKHIRINVNIRKFVQCFYTPGISAEVYIVFAFPFVLSSVRMFICDSVTYVEFTTKFYVQVS